MMNSPSEPACSSASRSFGEHHVLFYLLSFVPSYGEYEAAVGFGDKIKWLLIGTVR